MGVCGLYMWTVCGLDVYVWTCELRVVYVNSG